MSKILVLDDRQFQELKWLLDSKINDYFIPPNKERTSVYDSIQSTFEDAEKENRSVVNWHKYPDEKPKRKGYYYIKFKDDPRICEILLDKNDTILEDGEYWAEPPKFPSEG